MIMDIGREYKIGYKKIDDLVWSEIDSIEHYNKFIKRTYSRLLRKEQEVKIKNIKQKLQDILNIEEDEIAQKYIHEAFPNCTINQIEMTKIAQKGGALHCISWNIKQTPNS